MFWLFDARASRKAAIKHDLNERKRIRWGGSVRQQLYYVVRNSRDHRRSWRLHLRADFVFRTFRGSRSDTEASEINGAQQRNSTKRSCFIRG